MPGLMLDSTDSTAIIDAVRKNFTHRNQVVRAAALYADGQWPAPPAAFSLLRRMHIKTVDITVTGNPNIKAARIASDIEPGDLSPESGAQWAEGEKRAGEWPVLYVNRSNKAPTIAACLALGMEPKTDFGLWVATLDGTLTDTGGADLRQEPGVVAIQQIGAKEAGINADVSILTALGDTWLGLPPTWEAEALAQAHQLADLIAAHL
jgi:hypothetical protein